MSTKFVSPSPLLEIQKLAKTSKGYAAVPYLGKGSSSLLPLTEGSFLVTCMDEASVRGARVDPSEVVKYIRRGVHVHNCKNLHAKVYVFGRKAVVGSANVSNNGLKLVEAAVISTDPEVVAHAKRFVQDLCVDEIGIEYAKSLVPLYPTEFKGGGRGGKLTGKAVAEHSKTWLFPSGEYDYPDVVKAYDKKMRPKIAKKIADPRKAKLDTFLIDGYVNGGKDVIVEGDRIVERWSNGRGFDFYAPARVVHIKQIGEDTFMYLECPRHLRKVASSTVRAKLGERSKQFVMSSAKMYWLVRSQLAVNEFVGLWPVLSAG